MKDVKREKMMGMSMTILAKRYTKKAMVDQGTPEDTLFMTLLSARTRDEQVIKAYPGFRRAFPRLQDVAEASVLAIGKKISTIGLYRAKARALKATARLLITHHNGRVPSTMEELIALPGVGRKTASCVLAYAFKIPAIAVDTHVFRISHRLGWAQGRTPEKVEQELKQVIPRRFWLAINRVFVLFGREICTSRKPQCWRCPLAAMCAYPAKNLRT